MLDNLLSGADASRRPPVIALHEFASRRFDGWFDPVVKRAVLKRIPPFGVGTHVTLSDGRQAVVTAPNLKEPCRPAVRPLDGSPLTPDARSLPADRKQWLPPHLHIVECAGIDVEPWLYELPEPLSQAA